MIVKLLIATLLFIALSYAVNRFRHQPKPMRKQLTLKFGAYTLAGIILLLIVTGRVHWIMALFAGIVPFLSRLLPIAIRLLPFISQLRKQRMSEQMRWGNTSTLQTRFLKLDLDQESGAITGEVLEGMFAGKTLAELSQEQAQELLDFYRAEDRESHNLLLAYLQHRYKSEQFRDQNGGAANADQGTMSRREALEILGLEEGASTEDIVSAHKKLMQRLHPDRGGSNYLAVKVNQAKALLVGRR
ncbi:MAG: molecular chaperone DnaJ [Cellvibrionaceae bacterium]